jgi:DNA-binding NarL/FixJ family response regulator
MIKILIADDADMGRTAISRLLSTESSEAQVVAEAKTYREMMRLVGEYRPDVVLLDVHMGDESGVTVPEITSCLNGCQLFVISIWNDSETKAYAESLGAIRFLDKFMLSVELIPALKRVDRALAYRHAKPIVS